MRSLHIPKRAQDLFGRNRFTAIGLCDRFEELCLCRRIELEGFVAFASENRDDGTVWQGLSVDNDLPGNDPSGCNQHFGDSNPDALPLYSRPPNGRAEPQREVPRSRSR